MRPCPAGGAGGAPLFPPASRRGCLLSRAARGLAVLALALLAPVASAQEIELPNLPDRERFGRSADDYGLQFCVDPRSSSWHFDLAIGEALADALLLEARPVILDEANEEGDFSGLYRHLLEDCRVFFGFRLIAAGYPDWLTVTRPYYRTGYVFVAREGGPERLADIAPGGVVATAIASTADFRFTQYNNSLPAKRRWARHPYGRDDMALDKLAAGEAEAALVWGPAFAELQRSRADLDGLRVIDPSPLSLPDMPVAALLLAQDGYLRSAIDQAIDALAADGTIAAILAAEAMPGSPP